MKELRKILLLILPLVVLFVACKDDDPVGAENASFQLNVKATYDGEPLLTTQGYAYNDATIQFSTSEFFISEFIITNTDGEEIEIDKRAYVDFTNKNFDMVGAMEGYTIDLGAVPTGNYNKLKFAIGVPEEINKTTPDQYTSSDPLNQGEYWPGWESYIFMKQQGRYTDTSQNIDDLAFIFHTGSNELYREVELNINFAVEVNADNQSSIELDHKKLFEGPEGLFDIPSSPTNHQLSSIAAMEYLVNNLQSSFN